MSLKPLICCFSVNFGGSGFRKLVASTLTVFVSCEGATGAATEVCAPVRSTAPPMRMDSLLAIPPRKSFLMLISLLSGTAVKLCEKYTADLLGRENLIFTT